MTPVGVSERVSDTRYDRPSHTDYWNELPVIVGDGADDDR